MQAQFYDVKQRQKVNVEVVGKVKYQVRGQTRYALKGKTTDGRNLTKFVKQADYDAADVPAV